MQMEHSVKTLRFPLAAVFARHCVLSAGTQRRALPRQQSKEYIIINFPEWASNPQPSRSATTAERQPQSINYLSKTFKF